MAKRFQGRQAALLVAALLGLGVAAGPAVDAEAATKRRCQVVNLHVLGIGPQDCTYRSATGTGRVTVAARQWIVNVHSSHGHFAYACIPPHNGPVCPPRTFTVRTSPGGTVNLYVIDGVGLAGDA